MASRRCARGYIPEACASLSPFVPVRPARRRCPPRPLRRRGRARPSRAAGRGDDGRRRARRRASARLARAATRARTRAGPSSCPPFDRRRRPRSRTRAPTRARPGGLRVGDPHAVHGTGRGGRPLARHVPRAVRVPQGGKLVDTCRSGRLELDGRARCRPLPRAVSGVAGGAARGGGRRPSRAAVKTVRVEVEPGDGADGDAGPARRERDLRQQRDGLGPARRARAASTARSCGGG